jgi:uncharacterized membrane protein YbhN (UPF0104 family)
VGRRAWTWGRRFGVALVLVALVRTVGMGPFVDGVRGLGPRTLLAAAVIGAGITICSAWRWRVVAAALGVGLPLWAATAACYRSQFLNSALPGGVLGDVHRGLRHGTDAGDLGRGLRAVVWERTAGQVVQVVLAVGVLLALPSPLRAAMPAVVAAGGGAVLAGLVAGRLLARHGPARLSQSLRTVGGEVREALLHPGTWPAVVLASLVVCAGLLGVFLLAARSVGVDDGPVQLLPLALIVLLAAGLPLNIAGWGPREGVAAWVFAAAGLGAGPGAAVATAFGVLVLVAALPGAVLLLAGWLRPSRAGPEREPVGQAQSQAQAHELVHSAARKEDGVRHG